MIKTKKVSLLISTLGRGGAERVCVILANGLVRKGWDVEVVVMKDLPQSRKSALVDDVTFTSLGVRRSRYAPRKLAIHLNQRKPHIVITMNNEVVVAEFFARLFRLRDYRIVYRCVTTLSSVIYQMGEGFLAKLRYSLLKCVIANVDLIVNQCKGMQEDTLSELKVSQERCVTIYNPLQNPSNQCSPSKSLDLKVEVRFVLLSGRIDCNKAFDLAINALALTSQEHNEVELWIAGDGPLKSSLMNLADELGISNQVKFLGYRKDLPSFYRKAALVTLTSHFEGFPNVLLEAISHGTPIVSVDCPSGPAEIVEDGVNGFLVADRSPKKLAEVFEKALEFEWDESLITKSAERFSEEKIVGEWDALLTGLLDSRKVENA